MRRAAILALVLLPLLAGGAVAAEAEAEPDPLAGWRFVAAAWLFVPGVHGEVSADDVRSRVEPGPGAGLVQRVEAFRGPLGLCGEGAALWWRGAGREGSEAEGLLTTTDLAGAFRFEGLADLSLTVEGGLRHLATRVRSEGPAGRGDSGGRWFAPRLGIAAEAGLGERFTVSLRAAAVLGEGGGPDFSVAAGLRLSETATLEVGWRRLAIDGSSRRLRLDAALSGPFAGVVFRF